MGSQQPREDLTRFVGARLKPSNFEWHLSKHEPTQLI
jgi:hypothetical protein